MPTYNNRMATATANIGLDMKMRVSGTSRRPPGRVLSAASRGSSNWSLCDASHIAKISA